MTHRAEAGWEIVDGVGAAAGRDARRQQDAMHRRAELSHPGDLRDIASLGLTLPEAKQLLARVQQAVVAVQARDHAALRPACSGCGARMETGWHHGADYKTACWFDKLPEDHARIGISRSSPRRAPADYRMYRQLAPGPWFNSVEAETYGRLYAEILARLDPHQVAADLAALAEGRIPVLLCYERANGRDFCHRALVASWLAHELGQPVPEFGFGHLEQHQHPLLPTMLLT